MGIFHVAADVADAATTTVLAAPKPGAVLLSHYILDLGVPTLDLGGSVSRSGDNWTVNHAAASGADLHQVVGVFMDAVNTDDFTVNSTFVLTTNGPIISCNCPCECETPIVVDEIVLIGVGEDVIPVKVLSANLNPEDSSQWVYTLGAQDASQTINPEDVDCIRCPGENI